jgi:DNA-binding NarL/FixJ family response regulator
VKLKDERDTLSFTFKMAIEKAEMEKSVGAALLVMNAWADEAFRDKRVKVTDEVEQEIYRLANLGYAAHSIARRLDLTEPTVRARIGAVVKHKGMAFNVKGSGD